MSPKKNARKRAASGNHDDRPQKSPKIARNSGPKRKVNWVIPPNGTKIRKQGKYEYSFDKQDAIGFASALFDEEYHNLENLKENECPSYKPLLGSPVRNATDKNPNPHFKRYPKSRAYETLYREIQSGTGNPFDLGTLAFHQFVRAWSIARDVQGAVIVYAGRRPFVASTDADVSVINTEGETQAGFRLFIATNTQTQVQGFFIRLEPGNSVTVNDDVWSCEDKDEDLIIGPLTPYSAIEIQSEPIFIWNSGDGLFGRTKGGINITTGPDVNRLDENNSERQTVQWRQVVDANEVATGVGHDANRYEETQVDTADEEPVDTLDEGPVDTGIEGPSNIGSAPDSAVLGPNDTNTPSLSGPTGPTGPTGPSVSVDTSGSVPENPCAYFHKRLEDLLQTNNDLRIKPVGERLSLEDAFNAVASVTQAISSVHTDGKRRFHCFGHIDLHTWKSFMEDGTSKYTFHIIYPNRDLILPWRSGGHTYLVVIQRIDRAIKLTILDSAPWLTSPTSRQTTLERVQTLLWHVGYLEDEEELDNLKRGPINWITPSPTDQGWKAECFTILYAWAVAFGLELNPDFQGLDLPDEFFHEFRLLLAIVIRGFADWALIWAFLRCKALVNASEVAQGDRITNTIAAEKINGHLRGLKEKEGQTDQTDIGSVRPRYRFPNDYLQVHPGEFATDKWTPEHLKSWPGELKPKADRPVPGSSAQTQKIAHSKVQSPCEELRRKLHEKLSQKGIQADLKDLRRRDHIQPEFEYLECEEISYAIASVILQMNRESTSSYGRLGYLIDADVQSLRAGSDLVNGEPRRNGQPLIYSWTEGNHHVLHAIQYDENHVPTISMLDSLRLFGLKFRQRMFEGATAIMKKAWLQDENSVLPKSATYIQCAKQNAGWSCGLHTILNAWSLALGLTLNPKFERRKQDWEKPGSQFVRDAYDVVRLAQIGQADWSLIVAFLRCYGYVLPGGEVPESRRISKTWTVRSYTDISDYLGVLQESDLIYETSQHRGPGYQDRQPERIDFSRNGMGNRHNFLLAGDKPTHKQVTLGIASVVEAIDLFQKEEYLQRRHEDDLGIFTGGFALSSSESVIQIWEERSRGDSREDVRKLALRPRRCWLLPLTWGRHHYLAILQEEPYKEKTRFKVYIADSSTASYYMEEATKTQLLKKIKRFAYVMGWSAHRNKPKTVNFYPSIVYLSVPRHSADYESGSRTILNAWIYALGLRPNTRKNPLHDHELEEFYAFLDTALHGSLGWKDVFEFLKKNNHILETTADAVPANRRFARTVNQHATGDAGLAERIHGAEGQYEADDDPLQQLDIAEYPYDYGNNLSPAQLNLQPPDNNTGLHRDMEMSDEFDRDWGIDLAIARARRKRKSNLRFLDSIPDAGSNAPLFN